jgi:hypothetical protein
MKGKGVSILNVGGRIDWRGIGSTKSTDNRV